MAVPAPQSAPAWANELALAYESGASGAVHPVRQRARPPGRGRPAGQPRATTSRTSCSRASAWCSSYDLGNGLTIERGGEHRREMAGRASSSSSLREPLAGRAVDRAATCATSATCASLGSSEKTPQRGGDHARRGSDPAGRWHGLRARQPHEPAARLGLRLAVRRAAVREPADRRQPQRRRAADRDAPRRPRACACRCPTRPELQQALDILRKQSPQSVRGGRRTCRSSPACSRASPSASLEQLAKHSRTTRASRSPTPTSPGSRKNWWSATAPGLVEFVESQAHARRLPRAGSAEELAAPGHRAVARRRSQGAAHGLSAVRPGRHGQDLPRRVPRRRSRRAGGEAQEFPRSLGGLERRQSREDLPAHPRARPLHRVHRRSRPDARQARFRRERLRASRAASTR